MRYLKFIKYKLKVEEWEMRNEKWKENRKWNKL
jgi:hypothetical protein